jgi:hypothetical protein
MGRCSERDVPYLFEAFHRGANASTNTPEMASGCTWWIES